MSLYHQASMPPLGLNSNWYSQGRRDCIVTVWRASCQKDYTHSMAAHSMAAYWLPLGYLNWPIRFQILISLVVLTRNFRIAIAMAVGKIPRKMVDFNCFRRRLAAVFVGSRRHHRMKAIVFVGSHLHRRKRVLGFAGSQRIAATTANAD